MSVVETGEGKRGIFKCSASCTCGIKNCVFNVHMVGVVEIGHED